MALLYTLTIFAFQATQATLSTSLFNRPLFKNGIPFRGLYQNKTYLKRDFPLSTEAYYNRVALKGIPYLNWVQFK